MGYRFAPSATIFCVSSCPSISHVSRFDSTMLANICPVSSKKTPVSSSLRATGSKYDSKKPIWFSNHFPCGSGPRFATWARRNSKYKRPDHLTCATYKNRKMRRSFQRSIFRVTVNQKIAVPYAAMIEDCGPHRMLS